MKTNVWLLAGVVALTAACSGGSQSSSTTPAASTATTPSGQINGAGATFPNPIY